MAKKGRIRSALRKAGSDAANDFREKSLLFPNTGPKTVYGTAHFEIGGSPPRKRPAQWLRWVWEHPCRWVGSVVFRGPFERWLAKGWNPPKIVYTAIGVGSAGWLVYSVVNRKHESGLLVWIPFVILLVWLATEALRWRILHHRLERTPPLLPATAPGSVRLVATDFSEDFAEAQRIHKDFTGSDADKKAVADLLDRVNNKLLERRPDAALRFMPITAPPTAKAVEASKGLSSTVEQFFESAAATLTERDPTLGRLERHMHRLTAILHDFG